MAQSQTLTIERRSIDVIPADERHGSPWHQFTLWCGANLQITAIVDGALAVVFGVHPIWAIVGLLLGNLFGGAVMALHSAQGPRLGLPQMISSRAQFGVYGAVVPLVLVVIMYLGFAVTGTVLSGQAINAFLGVTEPAVGIVVFSALTAIIATVGYRLIHVMGRISTVIGAFSLFYLAYRLFTQHDVVAAVADSRFDAPAFLLAIALSAGWQLTFGPYVADYSRYLPASTSSRKVFATTLLGTVVGAQCSMTLGVLIATVAGETFLTNQVQFLGELAGPAVVAAIVYLVIVVGKLAANCLNAYGGFMCALTTVTAFTGSIRISKLARTLVIVSMMVVAAVIAIIASADFLNNFKNFILLLLMVFTPWSAINLIDYYLISHERVDLVALHDPDGAYGRWNAAALTSYVVGIVAQVPFLAQALYTGPITKMLGGADISWLVGLVVTAAIYYPWAKRTNPLGRLTSHPVAEAAPVEVKP